MTALHEIRRIRRDTRRRDLTVTSVERLGGVLVRVWLGGADLADFESAAADDHVKIFVPDGSGSEAKRDYTPRLFDAGARTLAIDFALHGTGADVGPATRWAMAAKPGDRLAIGGPRGSTIVPDDFDWYLLVGDETAIPAISRRIEDLPDAAIVHAIVSVEGDRTLPPMPEARGTAVVWARRTASADGGAALLSAVEAFAPPSEDGFVWIGAEADAARAVRELLVARGHPRQWIKASGYWLAGEGGAHTKIGDE